MRLILTRFINTSMMMMVNINKVLIASTNVNKSIKLPKKLFNSDFDKIVRVHV